MARLFGYACSESAEGTADAVSAMLRSVAGDRASHSASLGSCSFAVSGGGSVAQAGHVLTVVDGAFLNAADLPGGRHAEPAAQLADLYHRYGMGVALQKIDGDFVVALHDAATGDLWLGRDRVGVRPLYYWQRESQIAFASRPGALLALPAVSREVNARWVAVFAGSHYRYIDNHPDESPFADINQVPAGTVLLLKKGRADPRRYWSLEDSGDFTESEEELAEQYRALLFEAVGRRVAVSRQMAFTLSGGMDSSSVMASAVSMLGAQQHALSTVYTDKTYDESDEIGGFIAEKAVQWHPIHVEGFDLFETVRRMVRAHDEPVATATWLSHYLLCERAVGLGFETIFGGLGGDELNAGEYEYFPFHFADLAKAGQAAQLEREIDAWARHHDHPIHRKDRGVAATMMARLTDPSRPGITRVDRTRFTRYFGAVSRAFFDLGSFEPALDHPFNTCLKNRTYQDMFRETAPCCLRAEDRNCHAFGLSHMDPFFDHHLIEFMFRVSGSMKIRDGVTKQLLRRAMCGVLPEQTHTRIKKTGWNAPAHLWFSGRNLTQLEDLVRSRAFRERGIYDIPAVHALIAEHRDTVSSGASRENHMMFLWQLLNLELWFQELVDAPLAPTRVTSPSG